MKKWSFIIITMLLVNTLLTACSGDSTTTRNTKNDNILDVYTTVYPLQYFSERIGGNYVKINTIYPPGADEHAFEPSQKDMMQLADADLFIYIGLGLEGFVESTKATLENENVTLLAAGDGIKLQSAGTEEPEEEHEEHEEHEVLEEQSEEHNEEDHASHGDIDPHVWLDPLYSIELAREIKDAFIKQMPEQKEVFERNFAELKKELSDLDVQFKQVIDQAEQKEIMVAHAAYGYWEKRYELEQLSIAGLSTSSEPSQKQLEEIVELAKTNNIQYVFFEQNVSSKLSEIVQREINAKALTLHNLSVRTQEDIDQQKTYFTIMEENLQALQTALSK